MYYILYSDEIENLQPELKINVEVYGNGMTLPVKKGFFLFDRENAERYMSIWEESDSIMINGVTYKKDKKLTFENPVQAKIVFLKLKIKEAQETKFDYFFPESYKKLVKEFNELLEKYPEYAI